MDIITQRLKLSDIDGNLADKIHDKYKLDDPELVRKGKIPEFSQRYEKEFAYVDIIGSISKDRDSEIVIPKGGDLSMYGRTVTWCHQYHTLPHAKNQWIKVNKENQLIAKTQYFIDEKDPQDFGSKIWRYRSAGFPIGKSVGFVVLSYLEPDQYDEKTLSKLGLTLDQVKDVRRIFDKWSLLEYAETPIPAQAEAMDVGTVTKSFGAMLDMNIINKELAKDFGYVYEIIDKSQESQDVIQEEASQKAQETQDSGVSIDTTTQEKEVEDSFIEFTDPITEKSVSDTKSQEECTCEDSEYENDICKACGGKRKPKKEVKAPQCQCTECDATCAPEDGKCDMKCSECGALMSMSQDDMDEDEKSINELGYQITDEEIENLVNQFEKMISGEYKYFEFELEECEVDKVEKEVKFDADVNKKYLFEDCMLKVKYPTEEEIKTKNFDIASQPSIPSNKVLDIFCKFLGCKVKNIYQSDFVIPWTLAGSYLAGFKAICSQFEYKDTRNYSNSGTEFPPAYEIIKINSKTEDDFLVEGADFYLVNNKPIVCSFYQGYEGIYTSIYTSRSNKDVNKSVISSIHKWVEEKNPLKGEKFSLNKEFFDIDTKDNWDTVILDSNVEKVLKYSEKIIKEKEFNGRGILMLGSPGQGKTKSARILMSQCTDQTFIWVSSKDLTRTYYPEDKIALGFKLARSLAPSILLLEDIDNWINGKITDMMKTELDGLKKNKNVITILTTNNPENLPNALIDRPGRFHDVLNFDHPTKEIRVRMFKEWCGIENEDLITQTEGFSGAYMWELIEFAKSMVEDENISMEEALIQSLEKINSQKELIRNIKKENKNFDININPIESDIESFIELIDDEIAYKIKNNTSQINKSINDEPDFDFNKVISIVEKSLDKSLNTKFIDVDDLVYESLMKAKGKMFY